VSPLVAILLSYVLGSIPSAFMAGRAKGVDLRKHGSGNLGATNVFRVLGPTIGLAVFAVDMAKGAVPVALFPRFVAQSTIVASIGGDPRIVMAIACGLAAIIGHVRPVFLKFGRGGKGVATASGVFVALAPLPTLLTFIVFAVTVLVSGYVSLGSLICAALLPTLLAITIGPQSPVFWLSMLVAGFVFWTHRANISRLRNGEEHRFGNRNAPAGSSMAGVAIAAVIAVALALAARFP
jgi:glycerol-3-phosphate acyltransferase PlsY